MADSRARADQGSAGRGRRRRNPPGMPDPEAEVIALTPEILLGSHRFICYICNTTYKRPQNLRYHMRSHQLPSTEPDRRETAAARRENRRKVFICPEPSCEYHDPRRALGDVTGIKKHYGRKHGPEKNWGCEKCPKKYAVESDWKAHMKICDGSSSSSSSRRPLPQQQPAPFTPSNGPEIPAWFTLPLSPSPGPGPGPVPDLNLSPENPFSGMQHDESMVIVPESYYSISDQLPDSFTDFLMAGDHEGTRGPDQLDLFPIADQNLYNSQYPSHYNNYEPPSSMYPTDHS